MLSIIIPVYNEEKILSEKVKQLFLFCEKNVVVDWQIVIANNFSTDKTELIAQSLSQKFPKVKYFKLDQKGKGLAVRTGWQRYPAQIYCFMDADLATDLQSLPELVKEVDAGFDIVVGNRFDKRSKITRPWLRRLTSLAYHWLLKIIMRSKINDAPCGFKAVSQKVVDEILPLVADQEWFFDSELLLIAEKKGFQIKEISVIWRDRARHDKSKVKIFSLAWTYIQKLQALKKRLSSL